MQEVTNTSGYANSIHPRADTGHTTMVPPMWANGTGHWYTAGMSLLCRFCLRSRRFKNGSGHSLL